MPRNIQSELKQLAKVLALVGIKIVPNAAVAVYSFEILNSSVSAAQIFAAVRSIQGLLSPTNGNIIFTGISNDQRKIDKLSPEAITNAGLVLALTLGLGLGSVGIILSETVVEQLVPGADGEDAKSAMRIYSAIIPFLTVLTNISTGLCGAGAQKTELRIAFGEVIAGALAVAIFYASKESLGSQAFIHITVIHALLAVLLQFLLLKIDPRNFFKDFRENWRITKYLLGLGLSEGFLRGIDTLGWTAVTFFLSTIPDPRKALSDLTKLLLAADGVQGIVSQFRATPPSKFCLVAANLITGSACLAVGSGLSAMTGGEIVPGAISAMVLTKIIQNIIAELALARAADPLLANNRIVRFGWVITLMSIGAVLGYGLNDGEPENTLFMYALLTWATGAIANFLVFLKPPVALVIPPASDVEQAMVQQLAQPVVQPPLRKLSIFMPGAPDIEMDPLSPVATEVTHP